MREFKVGDKVRVIGVGTFSYMSNEIKIGDIRTVTEAEAGGVKLDDILCGWISIVDVELCKPKWTIYNNTLPWSDLSDKQKGKLLLSAHNNNAVHVDATYINNPSFDDNEGVYCAVNPKPVKPDPTMAELFMVDTMGCTWNDLASTIITKGWVKK
jgi:hypothetical protein